jgi:hypothetical protein
MTVESFANGVRIYDPGILIHKDDDREVFYKFFEHISVLFPILNH